MVLEPGAPAPDFALEAAVSDKMITPKMGIKLVLIFHGPKTQEVPKTVGKAIRAVYPDAPTVTVANVVNLKSMAGMWQKIAKAQIKATYEKMSQKFDNAEDYVIICPDWDNAVAPLFGVTDPDKTAAIAVLDGDGSILATQEGGDLAEAALAAL